LTLWDRSVAGDGDIISEETSLIRSTNSIAVDVAMMGMLMLMVLRRPLLVILLIILIDADHEQRMLGFSWPLFLQLQPGD